MDPYAIYGVTAESLLEVVRLVGQGQPCPSTDASEVLEQAALVADGTLTEAGTALFKTAWVLRDEVAALRALGLALRAVTPVQVIEQELLHFGTVPEAGALDLLRLHRAAPADLSVEELRATLRQLSRLGLVVYSSKFKTVRALAPPPEEARVGEQRSLAAMVSPKTPFMNLVRLRRILRLLHGTVWWADRHFGARLLEELAEELDTDRIDEVRILSGTAQNVVTPKSLKDFRRIQDEMAHRGVQAEWRVDERASDWHDRWLVDSGGAWNVPPVNTLFKNDYSEILPTGATPPLVEWWERSVPRLP